jgi:hypothetical protein
MDGRMTYTNANRFVTSVGKLGGVNVKCLAVNFVGPASIVSDAGY